MLVLTNDHCDSIDNSVGFGVSPIKKEMNT